MVEGNDDGMYTLPQCGHTFHTDCIMTWFRSHQTRCPLCNHNPLSFEDDYFGPYGAAREMSMRVIRKRKADDPAIGAELKRLKTLQEASGKCVQASRALKNLTLQDAIKEFGNIQIKDVQKKLYKLSSAERTARWKLKRQQRALLAMVPIIPIVLPVRRPAAQPPQPHAMQLRSR